MNQRAAASKGSHGRDWPVQLGTTDRIVETALKCVSGAAGCMFSHQRGLRARVLDTSRGIEEDACSSLSYPSLH